MNRCVGGRYVRARPPCHVGRGRNMRRRRGGIGWGDRSLGLAPVHALAHGRDRRCVRANAHDGEEAAAARRDGPTAGSRPWLTCGGCARARRWLYVCRLRMRPLQGCGCAWKLGLPHHGRTSHLSNGLSRDEFRDRGTGRAHSSHDHGACGGHGRRPPPSRVVGGQTCQRHRLWPPRRRRPGKPGYPQDAGEPSPMYRRRQWEVPRASYACAGRLPLGVVGARSACHPLAAWIGVPGGVQTRW